MSLFNENLKKARIEKKLKQQEIAAYLKVSVRTYQRYEDDTIPDLQTINKLNAFLGFDLTKDNPFTTKSVVNDYRDLIIDLQGKLLNRKDEYKLTLNSKEING